MNNAFAVTKRISSSWTSVAIQRPSQAFQLPAPITFLWGCHNGCRHFIAPKLDCRHKGELAGRVIPAPRAILNDGLQLCRAFASRAKTPKKQKNSKSTTSSVELRRLRPAEIVNVFGRLVDVNYGNDLLQAIQMQRINGVLDEEIKKPEVTPDMFTRGLAYLREHYSVDEDAAIRRRIEREEESIEQAALVEIEEAKKWQPQQSAKDDGVYGKSKVEEAVKNYNEYRKKVAEAREEYRQQRRENTEVVFEEELEKVGRGIQRKITEVHITNVGNMKIRRVKNTSYAPLERSPEEQVEELSQKSSEPGLIKAQGGQYNIRRRDDRSKAEEKWWHKYEKQAQLTDWDGISEPPYMPLSKRWGLPTLFMLLTVGASILFAQSYQAPPGEARLFPDIPPAATTILALASVNVVAYFLWKTPPMWRMMNKYMLLHAVIPRPFQLLGNTFSHQEFTHLAMNMTLLWLVGTGREFQLFAT
jgi:rhomboid-like protein